ncbi:unnamed protein product [Ilex paraguariensis]|uniref:F-box domain-containing protein n=1 Tax=Ilex paraguariensis TaxID=185542 RepID=A0ABC8R842_9AQUA
MLFFLITCFSFVLFHKFLSLKPLPQWACEMRLITPWFWKDFPFFLVIKWINNSLSVSITLIPSKMSIKKAALASKVENVELNGDMSLLDLPELVLECILERLPPDGLCRMAGVCSSLRERCMSDYLWEKHMKQKWGGIIDSAAFREWQFHVASRKDLSFFEQGNQRGLMGYLYKLWPLSLVRSNFENNSTRKNSLPVDSIMHWYLALEAGKFWFPAQVYNRENGHVGFMLSCYDAKLNYDPHTGTFEARYPPHGRRSVALESGVTWDRIRAPPVGTSPHDLHISDCLNELCPGDHIEIQWRRNKEFPYGWWYGVIGHLGSCDGNHSHCRCHESDMVVLEFNQYVPGSRWRCTTINRKDHREKGNEVDGFYGGMRKIHSTHEISTWKRLWPAEVLE